MRHAGILSALLLTAALLCAMPGIVRTPAVGRVSDSLRPPQLRTLTVWLMPGQVGDRKLLNEVCAAYEKQHKGTRIFLRVVTAEELTTENAVLPDVALFETGEIASPQEVFVPLEGDFEDTSGVYAGVRRAVPLWLSPNVLSIPAGWLKEDAPRSTQRESLLAAATAIPEQADTGIIKPEQLPWAQLVRRGALDEPEDVGWQQLLAACPAELQTQLVNALLGREEPTNAPSEQGDSWSTTQPKALGASPTPMPPVTAAARVETLSAHQQRVRKGEQLTACVLTPAVSSRVRYAAVCRDGEDARAFVRFLLDSAPMAPAHGLVSPGCQDGWTDALTQAAAQAYSVPGLLPNAFAHTHQELLSLCRDGFARLEDPVVTLLKLQ